jgi:hypothetical protein
MFASVKPSAAIVHRTIALKEHPQILDEILEKGLRDQRKRFENE